MVDKIIIKDRIPSNKIIIKESITKIYPSLENLNIVPSKQEQVFEHENSYGYDKVTVEPIEIKLQNKEIIPSNIDKEVTFDNNYDGLSKVTIKGDSNLIAANIKQNINIFGITGTYEGNDFNIYMQPNEPGTYKVYRRNGSIGKAYYCGNNAWRDNRGWEFCWWK